MKKILVVGGTGFIGTELVNRLLESNYQVVLLTRKCPLQYQKIVHEQLAVKSYLAFFKKNGDGAFDPDNDERFYAVINLAGSSIGKRRWSEATKQHILQSRLSIVEQLKTYFSSNNSWPEVWLNASAIGFYGDRKSTVMTEESKKGEGFLSTVADQWESSLADIPSQVQVKMARFGLVLGKKAIAVKKMKLPFYFFMGGSLGEKDGYVSWVSIQDAVRALQEMLENSALVGPINVVSPEPVQRGLFFKTLGATMGRRSWLHVPNKLLNIVLGEMSTLLLDSQRVLPQKLLDAGFEFKDGLEAAVNK